MGITTDSETAKSARHSVYATTTQPTIPQDVKKTPRPENQSRNTMATIADDDDRLLVRIGYTPVHALDLPR
jgi:hypothetical protein